MNKQKKMNEEFLDRWNIAAAIEEIPMDALFPEVRIVSDPSGKCDYTFGIIMNERRYNKSVSGDKRKCNLCDAVDFATLNPKLNLLPNEDILDFIVVPNKFPIVQGFSIAISKEERPIYTTNDLTNFVKEFSAIKDIGSKYGLKIFHNSEGFGATIPWHEHWHLTTFSEAYKIAGATYGQDAAEKKKVKGKEGISIMPEFPFAHLIFTDNDPEKISRFLGNAHEEMGGIILRGVIPHTISEGIDGTLVVIGKGYQDRCRSSAEVAGHIIVNKEDYLNTDFDYCMKEIGKIIPKKEHLKLESFI